MSKPLHIGILAGESSGDILGAGLMQELRSRQPDIRFTGIGGPLMAEQGLASDVPMERLSVMGLVEPLKRLPELLRIRRNLVSRLLADRPDVFIGIDSPDFNLGLELRLHRRGIRTVHYVSPSVWAWRQKRIHKIARAADLVLALLPFETAIYQAHGIPVSFVGHPLADSIAMEPDQPAARQQLGLPQQGRVLALLPGSRQGEVARIGPVFVETARLLLQQQPELHILIPCASPPRREQLLQMGAGQYQRLHLIDGRSREVMTAADAVILASGTAALEAMLLKRPMLVCYKMAALSYAIISRMLKVPYFSLPNLLAGEALVEELVQDQVNADALAARATQLLSEPQAQAQIVQRYYSLHQQLRRNASSRAAEEVLKIL